MKRKDEAGIHGEGAIIVDEAKVTANAPAREGLAKTELSAIGTSLTKQTETGEGTGGQYGPEVFADVFNRIIEGGSINRICSEPSMPSKKTFFKRIAEDSDLQEAYSRAMILRADYLAEEVVEIADTILPGVKTINKNGKVEIVTADMVERSRLMIDARKWQCSKLNPKKYGERLQTDVAVTVETHEERLQRLTGGK